MDLVFDKLLAAGGPLGVLVIVVYLFLRALKERDEAHRVWLSTTLEGWKQTLNAIDERHLVAREDSRHCMEGVTKALIENTRATQSLSESVRSCRLKT